MSRRGAGINKAARAMNALYDDVGGVATGRDGQPLNTTSGPIAYPPGTRVPVDYLTGAYISPAAARLPAPLSMNGDEVIVGPGAGPPPPPPPPPPPAPAPTAYRTGPRSWKRSIECRSVAKLIDLAAANGAIGLEFKIMPEVYRGLKPDVRIQFEGEV
jgi:hypothetical protein